jgi:hypothetical protein
LLSSAQKAKKEEEEMLEKMNEGEKRLVSQ